MRRTRTNDNCLIVNQIEIQLLFFERFQTDFIGYFVTIRAQGIDTFVFYDSAKTQK